MTALRGLLLLFLISMVIWPAQADEIRPGYLEWTETTQGSWRVIWKAPLKSRLIREGTIVIPDDCKKRREPEQKFTQAARITSYAFQCEGNLQGAEIGMAGLDVNDTDVLLRIQPLNKELRTVQLTTERPIVALFDDSQAGNVGWTYFVLGIAHILAGFDHLLFVVALVLLLRAERTGALWRIATAVTAFTVAHSLTLIGTTLGLVSLPRWPVEAVIALSIIFLAVEVVKSRRDTPRLSENAPWLVAFLFGLLHGFGFAGALAEIGLPEGDVPIALLTFNLGVEAGQLLIVAATWAILRLIFRWGKPVYKMTRMAGAYAIGITACFWFVERLIS